MSAVSWLTKQKIKLGLRLLKCTPQIQETARWYISKYVTIAIPSSASYDVSLLYDSNVKKKIISLIIDQCMPYKIDKDIDLASGETIVTIHYITKDTFDNLLYQVTDKLGSDNAEIKAEDLKPFFAMQSNDDNLLE